MVSFLKKKIADKPSHSKPLTDNENIQILANIFSHLPYLQPCDTISAHEKHSLPQAKQLFASAGPCQKDNWQREGLKKEFEDLEGENLGVGEQDPMSMKFNSGNSKDNELNLSKSEDGELNLLKTESNETNLSNTENNESNLLNSEDNGFNLSKTKKEESSKSSETLPTQDQVPTSPDVIYLSNIPRVCTTSIPLKKTVSFQETVTTHTHADFQSRLEKLRKQKSEERGQGFYGLLKRVFKRLFLCIRRK